VLHRLVGAVGPVTHAEIAAELSRGVGGSGFDKATVYRNLVELTEAGIVSRIEVGDHVWRFEVRSRGADGSPGEDHPHFVCTQCGSIACLADVDVQLSPRDPATRKSERATGPRIGTVSHVLLKGRCEDCV
jgi:Fur family ferric uptake transcriptional regulator